MEPEGSIRKDRAFDLKNGQDRLEGGTVDLSHPLNFAGVGEHKSIQFHSSLDHVGQ